MRTIALLMVVLATGCTTRAGAGAGIAGGLLVLAAGVQQATVEQDPDDEAHFDRGDLGTLLIAAGAIIIAGSIVVFAHDEPSSNAD